MAGLPKRQLHRACCADLRIDPGRFPARILGIKPTGLTTNGVVKYGSRDRVALVRKRHAMHVGDTITLSPKPDAVHLSDAATGLRL